MRSDEKKSFYYHADANSLGGFIEKPFPESISSQASVSLPSVGGYATARTEAFNFKEIVSCRSAYTRVSGRTIEEDSPWSTLVTSVVEGLNILEILTAERITAQISVEHARDGVPSRVSFAGTHFEKLRVGGQDVCPAFNSSLLSVCAEADNTREQRVWSGLLKTGQEQARKLIQSVAEGDDQDAYKWLIERYGWMESKPELQKDGCVLCSLVDGIEGAVPGRKIGHFVEIPDFGRIFLGEVLAFPNSIQLTMVRAELGCNVHGKIGVASGRINGSTMPPS